MRIIFAPNFMRSSLSLTDIKNQLYILASVLSLNCWFNPFTTLSANVVHSQISTVNHYHCPPRTMPFQMTIGYNDHINGQEGSCTMIQGTLLKLFFLIYFNLHTGDTWIFCQYFTYDGIFFPSTLNCHHHYFISQWKYWLLLGCRGISWRKWPR